MGNQKADRLVGKPASTMRTGDCFGQSRWRIFVCAATLFCDQSQILAAVWHVAHEPLPAIAANRQFRTIGEAAKTVRGGDRVIIHSGIYRESVIVEKAGTRKSPIVFESAPASNVMITGVDRLIEWQREEGPENIYSSPWLHRFIPWGKSDAFPEDDFHLLIGRPEQVFADDYALRQTLSRAAMERGSFFVDLTTQRLLVWLPTGKEIAGNSAATPRLEAATRAVLWESKGAYVTLRGLRFRYAANRAQQGAVIFRGEGDVAEDCIFERTNGLGAHFAGPDQVARRCTFQDNGQLGFSALRAHSLRITECLIRNNNTKGFSREWEAGGNKIVLSQNVVLERSRFLENRGVGIWFDIGNRHCTVRNCLIADNEDAGLFYEISYGLRAHDNVVCGNGLAANAGAWGAQSGISISSSPGCVVKRNLLVGNKEGLSFREQADRTTLEISNPAQTQQTLIWNHDETVKNNLIVYNQDVQTRGWFSVADERHWPESMQEQVHIRTIGKPFSLEDLRLNLSENAYGITDDQLLLIWGASFLRHVTYSTVQAVQEALKLEAGSHLISPTFKNYQRRDFRVDPKDFPAVRNCYPRGGIPGATLSTPSLR